MMCLSLLKRLAAGKGRLVPSSTKPPAFIPPVGVSDASLLTVKTIVERLHEDVMLSFSFLFFTFLLTNRLLDKSQDHPEALWNKIY